jgi:L-ascorbate metabolism protein UlaG (beta-lactamase superfamily)
MVRKMERATDPFDRISLILISHAHIDHFNPEIVSAHLESNQQAILICPRQVQQELQKADRYPHIASRVWQIMPEYELPGDVVVAEGLTVRVWRLMHSPYYEESDESTPRRNKHENVQNLGFTIGIDRKKVFHGGDWECDDGCDNTNPLGEDQIDLAFLSPTAYLRLYGPGTTMLAEHKKPKDIVLMHLYPPGNIGYLTEEEKEAIAGTTVFTSAMETLGFL